MELKKYPTDNIDAMKLTDETKIDKGKYNIQYKLKFIYSLSIL